MVVGRKNSRQVVWLRHASTVAVTSAPVVVANVPVSWVAVPVTSHPATVVVAPVVSNAVFDRVKTIWPRSASPEAFAETLNVPRTWSDPACKVALGAVPAASVGTDLRTTIVPLPEVSLEAISADPNEGLAAPDAAGPL